MIKSLHISNYALIKEIDIDFAPGLNIITGETGAGKSIMLGALGLLFGNRADTRVISDETKKSIVEVEFLTDGQSAVHALLAENDIDDNGDTLIMRRELSPAGRSRAFVNDTPASLSLMRELSLQMVDIHSQHQNLLLGDADYQLRIVDALAGHDDKVADYRAAYDEYQKLLHLYADTRDKLRRYKAESDFTAYQLEELTALNLKEGEDRELEAERDTLSEQSELKALITQAMEAMNGGESALSAIETSADAVRELSESLPETLALAQRMDAALAELRAVAAALENFDEQCQADGSRLEEVEGRLGKIYSLEAKHHVDSVGALLELQNRLAEQMAMSETGDQYLSELEMQARKAKKEAVVKAREISARRQQCAAELAKELCAAAIPLGMKNLRCEVSVTPSKLCRTGMDEVDFLFAFNKNQPLTPVGQTASGGEMSRLMLALKSVMGRRINLPTIIFDEIDTGVSGDVAAQMAGLMSDIAEDRQIITITHLAQVASKGSTHFKVYKEDDDQSTRTHVRLLGAEERVDELALMLSGDAADQSAVAAARSLLGKQ